MKGKKETFWDYYNDTAQKYSDFLSGLLLFFLAFTIPVVGFAAIVALVVAMFQSIGLWTLAILLVPTLIFGGPYLVAYVRWRRARRKTG